MPLRPVVGIISSILPNSLCSSITVLSEKVKATAEPPPPPLSLSNMYACMSNRTPPPPRRGGGGGTFFPRVVSSIFRLSLTHTHTHKLISVHFLRGVGLVPCCSFCFCKSGGDRLILLLALLVLTIHLSLFFFGTNKRACVRVRAHTHARTCNVCRHQPLKSYSGFHFLCSKL